MQHSYSDAINNKRVALLGPYPPPLGGVSVHIKRVKQKLERQQNSVSLFSTNASYRYRWMRLLQTV